jgi:hypothetical protein
MAGTHRTAPVIFIAATEAVADIFADDFGQVHDAGVTDAISAHGEIEQAQVVAKSAFFYRRFVPLRNEMVSLLTKAYRGFFKLAIANPRQTGDSPDHWAQIQLQPAIHACLAWIPSWYMLACDGQNQSVWRVGSVPFVPNQTLSFTIPITAPTPPTPALWRAPSWLFQLSGAFFGIGLMKPQHMPARDSEEKLGESYTRLLLKGSRRVFLWQLGDEINRARNEEFAAAGAIRTEGAKADRRGPNKRQGYQERLKLYGCIRAALRANSDLQGIELCAELDKRHAPPLFDWKKRGEWRDGLTWKEAWKDPKLKDRIRRVRQEALSAD